MKYPIEEKLPYLWLALLVLAIFMYVGLLLMYFNLPMVAVSAFAIIMLHLQILQEERYLTENYGEAYREYWKPVFRYLGRR